MRRASVKAEPVPAINGEFLACSGLSIRLGNRLAFAGTNWTWQRGEQWAILGPDGSGKSLLIKAVAGQVPLAQGEVRGPQGDSETVEPTPEEAVAVVSPEIQRQLVREETSFYQSRWHSGLEEGLRTVSQFLSQTSVEGHNPFEINPDRGNPRTFAARRSKFVEWLGIGPLMRRKIGQLSNGELRKTLLVFALLREPRLLVLEDPYAGLDIATRKRLSQAIARLMRAGWPVLVATNRPGEIPSLTTHLLVIDQHQIVAQGPKRQMLQFWAKQFGSDLASADPGALPEAKRSKGMGSLASPGEPLVELRDVTVVGGSKRILRHVTWTVREGECWAVLGPNGAGKTTLLNLIQGDHPQAYSQDLRLFGRSTESTQTLWESRQKLGWMSPELHQHYPTEWPAVDVVASGFHNTLGLYQACSRRQRALAAGWLQDLGLGRQARMLFGELTFGQQRLVLLARAVVKQPRLLILDEPCQGLDAEQRYQLLAAVDRVVAQTNCSLLFVTHHPKEWPRCISHVLRLEEGRVRSAGAFIEN